MHGSACTSSHTDPLKVEVVSNSGMTVLILGYAVVICPEVECPGGSKSNSEGSVPRTLYVEENCPPRIGDLKAKSNVMQLLYYELLQLHVLNCNDTKK